MCLNFMFLGRIFLSYRAKTWKHTHTETHTHTDGNTHTYTDAHKDSDEYSIVAFCKNATIIIGYNCCYRSLMQFKRPCMYQKIIN